jgi:hypothetical protein
MATTIQSKSKSGKAIQVAVIPESELGGATQERAHWAAVDICRALGCSNYRIVDAQGLVIASNKAGAPVSASRGDAPGRE